MIKLFIRLMKYVVHLINVLLHPIFGKTVNESDIAYFKIIMQTSF